MSTIFISHSANPIDRELLNYLQQRFSDKGFETYFSGLNEGFIINEGVKQAISQSDLVLVFLSKSAANSAYVQQEINMAVSLNKPFLIIKERGVELRGWMRERTAIEFDPQNTSPFVNKFNIWLNNIYNSSKGVENTGKMRQSERNLLIGLGITAGALLLGALFGNAGNNDEDE